MTPDKKEIACPTCGKKNTWAPDNQFRPFCSDRCKLIDLGAWADGSHRIPSNEPMNPDDFPEDDDTLK